MDLAAVWFVLLGVLLAGYAVLDGFDLGAGILHALARTDDERRAVLASIGPIWDGNEVWLVAFGGALFAAFPAAYATIFSGFYMVLMLLLCALVFRAVSIELRSKHPSAVWRTAWDAVFCLSSIAASALFGIGVGNAMLGVPLDEAGDYIGRFGDLFNAYALGVGALVVAMFAVHGAIYLYLKVPHGPLHDRLRDWMWHTWGVFLVLYVLGTVATLLHVPQATSNFERFPWALAVVVVNVLALANIPRAMHAGKPLQAFASSAITIVALVTLLGLALWPDIVAASNDPARCITVYRAASSPKTLGIMLVIAAVGMPFVLAYTAIVYWTFRGRVKQDGHGY